MKKLFKDRRALLALAVLFLFFLALYALLPYADDDWDWGTQGGLDRLASGFAGYNGRYAGNLLILLLTRVPFLKALMPALCMTALCALPALLCGGGPSALLCGAALVLCASRPIARETFLWLSGFANYVPGTLALLALVHCCGCPASRALSRPMQALYIALAFAGALFMEHITVCMVLLSLTVLLVRSAQARRVPRFSLLLFLSCALGAVCMFSNSAYLHIFARQDFYRAVAHPVSVWDFLYDDCYLTYYYIVYPNLVRDHPVALSALALSLTALYMQRRASLTPLRRRVACALCAFLCLFGFYLLVRTLYPGWEPLLSYTYPAELLASVALAGALFALIRLLAPARARFRMTLEALCIVFLCAPLFVIAPVNARNFLPTYVLTCVLCVECLHAAAGHLLDRAVVPLGCALVMAGALWMTVTVRNFVADRRRVQNAVQASLQGAQSVVLPRLPYEDFMWNATPGIGNDTTQAFYRLFYGLRSDIALDIVDYSTYYEMEKAHE